MACLPASPWPTFALLRRTAQNCPEKALQKKSGQPFTTVRQTRLQALKQISDLPYRKLVRLPSLRHLNHAHPDGVRQPAGDVPGRSLAGLVAIQHHDDLPKMPRQQFL